MLALALVGLLAAGLSACGANNDKLSKKAIIVEASAASTASTVETTTTVSSTLPSTTTAPTSTLAPTTVPPTTVPPTILPPTTAAPAPAPPPPPVAPVIVADSSEPEIVIPAQAPQGPSIVARTRGGTVPAFARIPADPTTTAPTWNFDPETMFGSPTTFLVTAEVGGWLQVVLPIRANNTRGWIPRDTVTLATTNMRALVTISARNVTVYDGNEVVADISAVVGKPSTPTPTGLFYVTDVIDTQDSGGVYGPYVLALSARSEVFDFFNGGEPLTALHGTSSPGLIGTAASNGCIRLPNDMSTFLATRLPLGTAVYIQS